MRKTVSFFDNSGRFVQATTGNFHSVILPTAEVIDLPYVEGFFDESYMLVGSDPVKRPPCPAVLDERTLRAVPAGSAITINNQTYDCPDGGDVELEFDQPGVYRIRVICWPYLDGEFEIENPTQ